MSLPAALPETARPPAVEIRQLSGMAEFEQAETLQARVWGAADIVESKSLLRPIQDEGGLVGGAFAAGAGLVGFIFGFPTRDPKVQHSHRLGVLPAWRSFGLGERLKWFQRAWCLERGIERVHWTVDPLRAVNAGLNIRRLGATAAVYLANYYGEMAGINAGTPSDRILIDWRLSDPRVMARLDGPPSDLGFPHARPANHPDGPGSSPEPGSLSAGPALVHLPEDFPALLDRDLPLALAWRLHLRRLLLHYFGLGYRITNFTRLPFPAYLLEK